MHSLHSQIWLVLGIASNTEMLKDRLNIGNQPEVVPKVAKSRYGKRQRHACTCLSSML